MKTLKIIFEIYSAGDGYANLVNRIGRCAECDFYQFGEEIEIEADPPADWPEVFSALPEVPWIVRSDVWKKMLTLNIRAKTSKVRVTNCGLGSTPPPYVHVNPEAGIEIDYVATGLLPKESCRVCGRYTGFDIKKHFKRDRYIPDYSTWTGLDLFRYRHIGMQHYFCTARFVELAIDLGWNNMSFRPTLWPEEGGDLIVENIATTDGVWPPEYLKQFI